MDGCECACRCGYIEKMFTLFSMLQLSSFFVLPFP